MVKTLDKWAKILEEKRLVPIMNNTKWQELANAMSRLPHLDPPVRVKYLSDEEAPADFAPIWWEHLAQTGYKWIEWLELKAVKETYTGLFVPTLQADYTDLIQDVLERYSIPHLVEGYIFRIEGYQQVS